MDRLVYWLLLATFIFVGCDTQSTRQNEGVEGTYYVNGSPNNYYLIDLGEGYEHYLVVSHNLILTDGRYQWDLFFGDRTGVTDTLSYEGKYVFTPPFLQFGEQDPHFGLVSEGSLILYAKTEEAPFLSSRWVFESSSGTADIETRLPTYKRTWASGKYSLMQVGEHDLPTWAFNSSSGIDSLAAGSLMLDRDEYQLTLHFTTGWSHDRSVSTDTLAGQFWQSGGLVIFDALTFYPFDPDGRSPLFGVVEGGALTLYNPVSGRRLHLHESVLKFEKDV